ncbi:transmembrane emp24 domain-containing protein 1-like [Neosynchiropus ocellatus]
MRTSALLGYLTLSAVWTSTLGRNQVTELTFLLPAGSAECFFQPARSDDRLEVVYRVIAGSGLDVGFGFFSPSGSKLASDFRASENYHVLDHTEDGDYRFCFDNSFSKFSEKMVFFRVNVIDRSGAGDDGWMDGVMEENMVGYELESIRATLDATRWNMERSHQTLIRLRSFEKMDLSLLEDNLWRVSFWSCVNLLVMMAVAATQVYTVRQLFRDAKRV